MGSHHDPFPVQVFERLLFWSGHSHSDLAILNKIKLKRIGIQVSMIDLLKYLVTLAGKGYPQQLSGIWGPDKGASGRSFSHAGALMSLFVRINPSLAWRKRN